MPQMRSLDPRCVFGLLVRQEVLEEPRADRDAELQIL